jgi:hypothetical protein
MKISSGGVGTVATAMSCNAKSAFPYVWAWNAIGESVGSGTGYVPESGLSGVAAVSTGVKWTAAAGPAGGSPYVSAIDASLLKLSGPLDNTDALKGKYFHTIWDFTGSALAAGGSSSLNELQIFWLVDDSNYKGIDAFLRYEQGSSTVLVFDMTGSDAAAGTANWGVSDITKIQPYFESISGLGGGTFIHQGMVLSDRILYDIPLPVRTHVG